MTLGRLTVDRFGVILRTRRCRYLLTAAADDPGFNLEKPPRKLYLLKEDFRSVVLALPWTRALWPRRNLGR